MFDANVIKKDFPILRRKIYGHPLVYLDNGASSQKPQEVIDAVVDFYTNHNANVHRGVHTLSEEASEMYEAARKTVADFIGASPEEITFTKGATESLNRINYEWGVANLKKGDVILTTDFEHHSNLIPWQILCQITGAKLDFIEADVDGLVTLDAAKQKMTEKVGLVAVTHASNVLGTIVPVKGICDLAKKVGARVVVDGAQAAPHLRVNVKALGCDFYAVAGHKMLGPTGIGVLYIRKELLEQTDPYEYGGGMIDEVTYDKASWASAPEKFEAGTPNIAGAIGLAAAARYLQRLGMDNVQAHSTELNTYALKKLEKIPDLTVLGPKDPTKRVGLVTFTIKGLHAHDIAAVLSSLGIAVRSGHHCVMPYHKKLGIPASVRASFCVYNTKEDIDALVNGVREAVNTLS